MPKCKVCGVNALLLKVNEDGICKSCERKIAKGKIVLPEKNLALEESNRFDELVNLTIAKDRLIRALDKPAEIHPTHSGFYIEDEMFPAAIECVVENGQASTSLLHRKLKLGYARAARIIDKMESQGIVGPFEGSKPRQVLISRQQWIELKIKSSDKK